MKRALASLVGVIALAFAGAAPAAAPKGFSDWAAVVVAGDYMGAHNEGETEAFDNARRDVAKTLVEKMGFAPANVKQFSVHPNRYKPTPGRSSLFAIQNALLATASHAKGGCLFYFTSHGTQYGAFLNAADEGDQTVIFPTVMAELVDSACPGRPTIVVISTCFSGVNVPALQKDDRLVMTAARKDRSSFGCGQQNTYPYFDQCFLESAAAATDFSTIPTAVVACVERMEQETGAAPPSEPQVYIGSTIKPLLPLYAFRKGG